MIIFYMFIFIAGAALGQGQFFAAIAALVAALAFLGMRNKMKRDGKWD
jgi:hypothetical protein